MIQGGDVGVQTVGDGQSGGVIRAAVDARARRQLEEGLLQAGVGHAHLILRHQGRDVIE